ncbi:hypothetical protein HK100_003953 [Physocladia obscura]|uniref:Uncharacterized protein n=1 Tax=Physocladia obscura TaxID=109957 RepID=A0AAD5T6H6_9FUNG|nr:hypothetical protein HK100_003953 [Physocladia obscura]
MISTLPKSAEVHVGDSSSGVQTTNQIPIYTQHKIEDTDTNNGELLENFRGSDAWASAIPLVRVSNKNETFTQRESVSDKEDNIVRSSILGKEYDDQSDSSLDSEEGNRAGVKGKNLVAETQMEIEEQKLDEFGVKEKQDSDSDSNSSREYDEKDKSAEVSENQRRYDEKIAEAHELEEMKGDSPAHTENEKFVDIKEISKKVESVFSGSLDPEDSELQPLPVPALEATETPISTDINGNEETTMITIQIPKNGAFQESDYPQISAVGLKSVKEAIAQGKKSGRMPKYITVKRERMVKKGLVKGGIAKKEQNVGKSSVFKGVGSFFSKFWNSLGMRRASPAVESSDEEFMQM